MFSKIFLILIITIVSSLWPLYDSFSITKVSLPKAGPRNSIFPLSVKSDYATLDIEPAIKSVLVVDLKEKKSLLQKNIFEVLPIASLTKLMSSLVFLESNLNWNELVTLEQDDWTEWTNVKAKPGDKIKIKDLFYASLVGSTNNTTKALARISFNNNFVDKMNQKVKEINLKNTFFADPTGLEPKNTSTALDLAILLNEVLKNQEIKKALELNQYRFQVFDKRGVKKNFYLFNSINLIKQNNQFSLLGKTGYTEEAGYCFAGLIKHKDKEVMIIILGAETQQQRAEVIKKIGQWVFKKS